MKRVTECLLFIFSLLSAAMGMGTNTPIAQKQSGPFAFDYQFGTVRTVPSRETLPIAYSDRWGGTNEVSIKNGGHLFSKGGEGVYAWTLPEGVKKITLINSIGDSREEVELIFIANNNTPTTISSCDSDPASSLYMENGIIPILNAGSYPLKYAYSDRWDDQPGGEGFIKRDGETWFQTPAGEGEARFDLAALQSGPLQLTHSEGRYESTREFYVMRGVSLDLDDTFKLKTGNLNFDKETCFWQLAEGAELPAGLELMEDGSLKGRVSDPTLENSSLSFTVMVSTKKNGEGDRLYKTFPLKIIRSGSVLILM